MYGWVCKDPVTYVASVLPILPDAACPVFVLKFLLLYSLSLSSGPGYLLYFSHTGTRSSVGHLTSLSSGVPKVFISGAVAPNFKFLPRLATKQQTDF